MTDRRIWVMIETERMLVIARRHAVRGRCERCVTEIEFLPSDQVRRRLDTTLKTSAGTASKQPSSVAGERWADPGLC
jgi:hypothetical protein